MSGNYRSWKRNGWFGNPEGHAMAARGIRLYARKPGYQDPLFYAQKHEEKVSFNHILDMIQDGKLYASLMEMHPEADKEDLRLRGIKAIEQREGNNVLSTLNRNGIDQSVSMARHDSSMKGRMLEALNDRQKSSFLPELKVNLLKRRLEEVPM